MDPLQIVSDLLTQRFLLPLLFFGSSVIVILMAYLKSRSLEMEFAENWRSRPKEMKKLIEKYAAFLCAQCPEAFEDAIRRRYLEKQIEALLPQSEEPYHMGNVYEFSERGREHKK